MVGTDGWKRWLEKMVGKDGWKRWLEKMVGTNGEVNPNPRLVFIEYAMDGTHNLRSAKHNLQLFINTLKIQSEVFLGVYVNIP
jgi:hypothetical protein